MADSLGLPDIKKHCAINIKFSELGLRLRLQKEHEDIFKKAPSSAATFK